MPHTWIPDPNAAAAAFRRVRIVAGDKVEIFQTDGSTTVVTVEDVWERVGVVTINPEGLPLVYPWATMIAAVVRARAR